ncbi:glycosyltransferase family 2 protein [Candidatus Uhrbacteria bacterium]|nr:glycosyltransferase family 2 protein [Candidatus Uhrbacteria bacterium]
MVYVVVLSYHAPEDLRRCLISVLATQYPAARWRVVVVDNDAQPETQAVLRSYGDMIDVVAEPVNRGYAGGMNVGIRHALTRGAAQVVLLNQDTEVDPHWLSHLVAAVESDPRIAAAQARVMLGRSDDLVNSVGNQIHVLGFGFAGGNRESWSVVRSRLTGYPYPEVTYPSGAAVLFRADALRAVAFPCVMHRGEDAYGEDALEFFDEDFFLYHEDLDLGVRFWLQGWRCVVVPQAVVQHYYEFARSIRKLFWIERNRFLFLYENFRWGTLFLLAPVFMIAEAAHVVLSVRGGWWGEKRRAWRALVTRAQWPAFRAHRAAKHALRTRPDSVVVHRWTTSIRNQEMPNRFAERFGDPCIRVWWRCVRPLIRW